MSGHGYIVAIEIFDTEMVGASGYDYKVLESFARNNISYIAKNTNANTITHYVSEKSRNVAKCIETLEKEIKEIVEQTSLKHIAIIMDGNGRWAKKRGMPKVTKKEIAT